ncbi:MAG: elongation factor P [Parachlamydiales bacterium]|jgi:elongation factor P|nr:elongation factor P [Verrucomicrobiota bacterium]MBS0651324.1 elongation factor P [Verrucomicrobiota bacterium]MBX3718906.1 elongation factor P [Candidatus Acheromyda pituitae]
MTTTNQLTPGMTISLDDKIYRVESCVKVTVAKGVPFIKTKLKDLMSDDVVEKNFKLNQPVQDVSLAERRLEYLYLEGKDYLFLDIGNLEQVLVPSQVIGDKVNYLKEGTELKAMFYGNSIFSVELPQFLELMVVKTEESQSAAHVANATKIAVLETGAKVEVPMFVESGDIVKVDTQTNEYIQRV